MPPHWASAAVDLVARAPQPWHTVPIQVSLPSEKFFDRDAVKLAHLFDRNPAAAHCMDHYCLALHRPALAWSGQVRNKIQLPERGVVGSTQFKQLPGSCEGAAHKTRQRFRFR